MIGNTATRCLLATLAQSRPTVRSVAAEVGCAVSTAYVALRKLDAQGLVVFERGKQGVIRAAVEVVETVDQTFGNGVESELPPTRSGAGDALVTHPGSVSGPIHLAKEGH